jgi:hypothetical protein
MVSLLKIRQIILFGVEGIMAENAFMVSKVNFVEVVHVELADKRGEPVVAVVAGQDCFFKLFLIDDADAFSFRIPNYGFAVLF